VPCRLEIAPRQFLPLFWIKPHASLSIRTTLDIGLSSVIR
jgi:hypothetical protein